MSYDHFSFLSPFTWRYGSNTMRMIWSEAHKRRLWRQVWLALAETQQEAGLVTAEQVEDLRAQVDNIDIERAQAIEAEIHHDLMAEIKTYAEQCPVGGGIIHLGATSMDIEDNAEVLRLRESLQLILVRLQEVLETLAGLIEREADSVCMAFTHLQPAEPTTIGYRLATYAQDLLEDFQGLDQVAGQLRGKGLKGAVGTSASYSELLSDSRMSARELEARVMESLELKPYLIATQTYSRRQDWILLSALAGCGMTLYKMAFDLRLLQSPPLGEWSEPFGEHQVGSSAMPFKRNPINAENMGSMARYLAALPGVAWDNAAHNLLERTLDDSGNRRIILPNAFFVTEEILKRAQRILGDLRLNRDVIQRNLAVYGTFAATERVLMAAARAGGDRQALHEVIRQHSLSAWAALQSGQANPLIDSLSSDPQLTGLLDAATIRNLLNADAYVGDAPQRARELADALRESFD